MAEPKKETVRIALPPRPEQAGSAPSEPKRETARIVLPARAPVTPIRREPPKITPLPAATGNAPTPTILPRRPPTITPNPSPLLQPLPKPPGLENENGPVPRAAVESPSVNRGPKKETARISVLPRPTPTAAPAINMTKTQPLLVHPPTTAVQTAPVIITSKPLAQLDVIPRPLCWALLGISAVIFLIQIWNYVVS